VICQQTQQSFSFPTPVPADHRSLAPAQERWQVEGKEFASTSQLVDGFKSSPEGTPATYSYTHRIGAFQNKGRREAMLTTSAMGLGVGLLTSMFTGIEGVHVLAYVGAGVGVGLLAGLAINRPRTEEGTVSGQLEGSGKDLAFRVKDESVKDPTADHYELYSGQTWSKPPNPEEFDLAKSLRNRIVPLADYANAPKVKDPSTSEQWWKGSFGPPYVWQFPQKPREIDPDSMQSY
jgi:hypothetical protein